MATMLLGIFDRSCSTTSLLPMRDRLRGSTRPASAVIIASREALDM